MTRTAGAAWPSPRWSPAAASFPAPASRRTLLFTGVHAQFLRRARPCGGPALCRGRPRCAAVSNVVIDRGVKIPAGLVVGEDPELDAQALPPHRTGHLPHHPDDDRPSRRMSPSGGPRRSPRRSIPLVKTGGLADVAGALPAALAAEDIRMRTLVPGYPAVMSALETAEEIYSFADCSSALRPAAGRPRRGSRSLRARCAASLRPAGQSL